MNKFLPSAVLVLAGIAVSHWWISESTSPASIVAEHESPAVDKGKHAPLMADAMSDIKGDNKVGIDEPPGIGDLVITVVDGAQFPLTDEQVEIRRAGHTKNTSIGLTDHHGEVTFEDLVEGGYLYFISTTARPELVASAPVVITAGETTAVTVIVRSHDSTIAGTVIDRNGVPVTGLLVSAQTHLIASAKGASVLQRHSPASAKTDEDGNFLISNLQAGEYQISTEENERYSSTSVILRTGAESALLTVAEQRIRWIAGTVTDAIGQPLSGVKVMPPPGSADTVLTDLHGSYLLILNETSAVGRRNLRFLLDNYQETRVVLDDSLFEHEEPLTIDARLTSLGATLTVAGGITDEYGAAVAGERVQLHSRSRYTTYRTLSDANGEFLFEGVATSDDYALWVRPMGPYGDYREASVALISGQPYFNIVLPDLVTGTVQGRVLDGQYNPVPAFSFWLRSASATGRALPVTADSAGSFSVQQVPAGRLTLGTRSKPQIRITGIELAAGDVKNIDVVLKQGDVGLSGFVD